MGRHPSTAKRSARPFHDWNERIHAECYRPNAFARITDNRGRVERIVNNYARISFNFGPNLAQLARRRTPRYLMRVSLRPTERAFAIIRATATLSLKVTTTRYCRFAMSVTGSTQIRWGIADFSHRFGRFPESLWLPETACNDATLGTMIDAGLVYAILSPTQAQRVRTLGAGEWQDVSGGNIDPHRSYRYFHRVGSGRSIAIFFYDPGISLAIAYEGALAWSSNLVDRLARALGNGEMVNVATDGESYGHHFPFGDRCLAYSLAVEAPSRGLALTNYGEFLTNHLPRDEVEIKSGPDGLGTAWSCQHGVGRWYRDCGCQTDGAEGWNQRWRGPLRWALDLLRDEAARQFEELGGDLFRDPWAARDAYIEVIRNPSPAFRNQFLDRHAKGTP